MRTALVYLMVLGIWLLGCQRNVEVEGQIVSVPVEEIDISQPGAISFENAPVTRVKASPQNLVIPVLHEGSIEELTVRSVYDRNWIAFELVWEDPTRNATVDVDKFTDQVAIQFPLDPERPPSFMMGHKGGRVQILHWKAIWQDDVEKGYRDVADLYPNYWVDMYFFPEESVYAEGEVPPQIELERFQTSEALMYMPGIYTRNPVSRVRREVPAEDGMAEGFGTFTTQPHQNVVAWGKWQDGRWRVILLRPVVSPDPNDAPVPRETSVAFAVWDGGHKNVGGRKHYTQWIKLIREE